MNGQWLTDIIDIQNPQNTKDDIGQIIYDWTLYKQTRAREVFKSGNERFEDGDRNFQVKEFEVRFDLNINENQRIIYNSEVYQIKAKRQIKRRQGLILTCEKVVDA